MRQAAVGGTTHHHARDYNATLKGWLQTDQYMDPHADLGLSLDPLNRQRSMYAAGNPISYTDPWGHEVCVTLPIIGKKCTKWDEKAAAVVDTTVKAVKGDTSPTRVRSILPSGTFGGVVSVTSPRPVTLQQQYVIDRFSDFRDAFTGNPSPPDYPDGALGLTGAVMEFADANTDSFFRATGKSLGNAGTALGYAETYGNGRNRGFTKADAHVAAAYASAAPAVAASICGAATRNARVGIACGSAVGFVSAPVSLGVMDFFTTSTYTRPEAMCSAGGTEGFIAQPAGC